MSLASTTGASACCFAGIEIGGTKLQLVVGDGCGQIQHRQRLTVDAARGAESIREQIAQSLPQLIAQWRPQAIGVGFGGPVDWRTGVIVKSHQVAGWNGFALGNWLCDLSGLPVFVENDANVAALAEALAGAGRDCDPVFYVTLGSGVGGGLVQDGRIYHGAAPGEAEIGHLRIDNSGLTVEDRCSGWNLDRRIRESIARRPDGPLARRAITSPGNEARHLGPALAEGDELAAKLLDEVTRPLALALSHVTHLCHPQVIVIGGGVSLIGEPFRAAVAGHLTPLVMDAFQPGPRLALASLREDAVPAGALALASQHADSTNVLVQEPQT